MTIRYRYQRAPGTLRVERVPAPAPTAPEAALLEAEELRDRAALLEAKARDTRRRAHALIQGLIEDRRRRIAAGGAEGRRAPARFRVTSGQLRRARVLAKVSQRQLAATWNLSRGAIAAYEDDRAPHQMHEGIAAWVLQVLRAAGEEVDG